MKSLKRVLIFAGGRLGEWALNEITPGDYIIGADRGAYFLVQHDIRPDVSVGDFDSVNPQELEKIRRGSKSFQACDPIDKNYTDSELAFIHALALKPSEVILLGGLGSRFDHSLANVHLLYKALMQGVNGKIIDSHHQIMLMNKEIILQKGRYAYVSLLPFSEQVTGISLEGFTYPLHEAVLHIGHCLGISNILLQESGSIHIDSGLLLVIQSNDEMTFKE